MNNFDLTKYLANNPLLKEGLSSKEQMVVDDILSVTEGPKDVYNKLVSYGKKGLISLAVLSSVLVGCAEQGDMESAEATIEYVIENNWAGSDEQKMALTAIAYLDSLDANDDAPGETFPGFDVMNATSQDIDRLRDEEKEAWYAGQENPEDKGFQAMERDAMYNTARLYFYRMLDGEGANKFNYPGARDLTDKEKQETLNYTAQIQNKLNSNPSLANKILYKELKVVADYVKRGGNDLPKWFKIIK